ncbi:MAG: AraC family transcriptional regulator [Opitutae bacterium]|nr:AraC family transcriptional regulator [Opitutae bacterium]
MKRQKSGVLIHRLHVPTAPVSRFVENMWLVRGRLPQPLRQILLPDGAFVVIFNLGEPQRLCERADVREHAVFRASWVSGQQPQPIVIEQAGACHLAGIKFRPGGAFPLFRFSLAELTGRVVELEDIWGRVAGEVRARLDAARGDDARLACLERWLAQRLRLEDAPDPRVSFAATLLQRGGTGVGRIAEEVNLSHKHFVHEFTRRVGLAPKHYGRVQRLQRAISWIGQRARVDWAHAALANGFYDQAHLINEFCNLTELTPGEYLVRRSLYPGYLNMT